MYRDRKGLILLPSLLVMCNYRSHVGPGMSDFATSSCVMKWESELLNRPYYIIIFFIFIVIFYLFSEVYQTKRPGEQIYMETSETPIVLLETERLDFRNILLTCMNYFYFLFNI